MVVAVIEPAGGLSGWLRAGRMGDLLHSPRAALFSIILSFKIKGSNSKGTVLVFTVAFHKVIQILKTSFIDFGNYHQKRFPKHFPHSKSNLLYSTSLSFCSSSQVVELFAGSDVYIYRPDLSAAKKRAKSGSHCARLLMEAIYTTEALTTCSLQGELATAGGKHMKRTALDPNALRAIIGKKLVFTEIVKGT